MELIMLAVGAVLLLVLIQVASRIGSGLDRKHFVAKWRQIEQTMQTADIGPRLAVIDADKLLDQALRQSKYRGKNMGERLRSAEKSIKNYQSVWDAHKLRNRLVHEDVSLKKSQANQALGSFKTALKSLGAL